MEIGEKEGGLPVFEIGILNTFFFFFFFFCQLLKLFLPTAEITTWLTDKISVHFPTAEWLIFILYVDM